MIIHLFAPFYTGSHKAWADGYSKNSRHDVRIFSLPGKYWKWRMHGAAVSLAQQFLDQDEQPDLLLVTDMLDLATFMALTRHRTASIPTALYFHENQLTYPWSPTDEDVSLRRDRHYSWINYTSALSADQLFFNSKYNQDSFLTALPSFLKAFPDYRGLENVDLLAEKANVLSLGMNLKALDAFSVESKNSHPVLLWNHRWEYDKDPAAFFQLCYRLEAEDHNFRLVVLGEHYAKAPSSFTKAKDLLADKILHWGYAESFEEYAHWLWRADILPVTSRQDFFGGSVVEAMYCQTYPLLPNRLAFPEHIPAEYQAAHLYDNEEDLFLKISALLKKGNAIQNSLYSEWVRDYDWSKLVAIYDAIFEGDRII